MWTGRQFNPLGFGGRSRVHEKSLLAFDPWLSYLSRCRYPHPAPSKCGQLTRGILIGSGCYLDVW